MPELNGFPPGGDPIHRARTPQGATRRDPHGSGHVVPDTSVSPTRGGLTMLAIAAAVLFLIALIFEPIGFSISVITPNVLLSLGAIGVALHLAGIGHRRRAPVA